MRGNALGYLICTKIKNQLISFLKKPVRLIYVLLFVGLIGLTVFGGNRGAGETDRKIRDISELTAGLHLLLIGIFSINFYAGLNAGGSIFKMSDVNVLFPSPLKPRNILFYALFQQLGTSLLIGIFILFQYSSLHIYYNLSFWGLILIFLTYSIVVFFSQTMATIVYTFVSDSDRKKRNAKLLFLLLLLAEIFYLGLRLLENHTNALGAALASANSLPFRLFPFAGWLGSAASGVLTGAYLEAGLWLGLSMLAFFGAVSVISHSKREYYEDVLAMAENMQTVVNSSRDGIAPEAAPRHIKVGKQGLRRGEGAQVFFYKHLLENRRMSKLWVKPLSLFFVVMCIGFALFMKNGGLIPVFAFAAYLQIFTVGIGRFGREIQKPYIYLIPEPPFKKMVFALAETLPTELLEGTLLFLPVAFILQIPLPVLLLCILARLSFSTLFLASSILIDRIWGGALSKATGMLLYILVDVGLALPGVALAIVLRVTGITPIGTAATALLALVLCNIPISALIIYLCRNMLQHAEL